MAHSKATRYMLIGHRQSKEVRSSWYTLNDIYNAGKTMQVRPKIVGEILKYTLKPMIWNSHSHEWMNSGYTKESFAKHISQFYKHGHKLNSTKVTCIFNVSLYVQLRDVGMISGQFISKAVCDYISKGRNVRIPAKLIFSSNSSVRQ